MGKIEDEYIDIPPGVVKGTPQYETFLKNVVEAQKKEGRVLAKIQPQIGRLRFKVGAVILGPARPNRTVPERTPPKKRRR